MDSLKSTAGRSFLKDFSLIQRSIRSHGNPGPLGCFQRRTCEQLFTTSIFSSDWTIHPSFFTFRHPLGCSYLECVFNLCLCCTMGLLMLSNGVSLNSCVVYPFCFMFWWFFWEAVAVRVVKLALRLVCWVLNNLKDEKNIITCKNWRTYLFVAMFLKTCKRSLKKLM